jgi:predicted nucleotidyltransferase
MSALREEIERAVVQPLHASLFGSVARGTEQQGSDVDLLVVQPDFASEDEKAAFDRLMVTMVFAVDRTVDRDLRTVRLSIARLERLAKSGSMLLVDVLREGRTVWGPPLLEVLAPIVAAVTASSRP